MMFYLAIERLRQSDDTGTRVDDEMVRELYAIFHWRSFGIVALQDEYFRPDLGRFRKWQARRISSGFQDRWLVHVVTRWNNKKETFVFESFLWLAILITHTPGEFLPIYLSIYSSRYHSPYMLRAAFARNEIFRVSRKFILSKRVQFLSY